MTALAKTHQHRPLIEADAESGAGLALFTSGCAPADMEMTRGGGLDLFTSGCLSEAPRLAEGEGTALFTSGC